MNFRFDPVTETAIPTLIGNHLIVFHYGDIHSKDSILQNGINRGKTQVKPRMTVDSVWLTLNPRPWEQTWDEGTERFLTFEERRRIEWMDRCTVPMDAMWPNKRAVRHTLIIPQDDSRLVPYVRFAAKHVKKSIDRGIRRAAPGCDPKDWLLYFGKVPPEWIIDVHDIPRELQMAPPTNDNMMEAVAKNANSHD